MKQQKKVIAASSGAVDPVAVPVEILKIAVVYSHQRSGHGSFSLTVLICYRLFYGLLEDMSRIWEIPLFYLQDDVVIYIPIFDSLRAEKAKILRKIKGFGFLRLAYFFCLFRFSKNFFHLF